MQTIYESQFTRILSNMFLDTREVQGNDDICAMLKSLVKLYVKFISHLLYSALFNKYLRVYIIIKSTNWAQIIN